MSELANRVNALAVEYEHTDNDERREMLGIKLKELSLRLILGARTADVGNDKLQKMMSKRSEIVAFDAVAAVEAGGKYARGFDGVTFVECMEYALKAFSSDRGNFVTLLLKAYKQRIMGTVQEEYNAQKNTNIKMSNVLLRKNKAFNNMLRVYAQENPSYAGVKLMDLSRQQIHEVMDAMGMSQSEEEGYYKIAVQLRAIRQSSAATSKSENADEDEERDELSKVSGSYIDVERYDFYNEVIGWYKWVFGQATATQKKYFACFVVQDCLNAGNLGLLAYLQDFYDEGYYIYVLRSNKYSTAIQDMSVAEYHQVGKAAISKKRAEYVALLMEAKNKGD